jgi:polysaccharide pyruvyl transferase WcaK-like protein
VRVALSYWYSDENLGDVAIAFAQLEMLAAHQPPPEVLVLGADSAVTAPAALSKYVALVAPNPWGAPETVGLVRWVLQAMGALLSLAVPGARWLPASFREYSNHVRGCDAFMPKGGGYLYARPGLRGLLFTARIAWPLLLARRLGVPRVLWGHSIGPAENPLGAFILRMALRGADIVLRDSASAALVQSWGLAYRRRPDLALGLKPSRGVRRRSESAGASRIAITARLVSSSKIEQAEYERALATAVDLVAAQARSEGLAPEIVLLPQVTGPSTQEDDRPVLRRVAASLSTPAQLIDLDHSRLDAALAVYASIDFLVATRLHSAILASCVGTPFLVFEYIGGKAHGVVDDLGLPEWIVVDRASDLPGRALEAWAIRAETQRRIAEAHERVVCDLADLRLNRPPAMP